MKKTLLLCFIHGFKGGDDTFGTFPEDLRARLSHALPKINVKTIVYPKYETRGDLAECVSRFRDWLLEKVIDIEVDAHTPSPTIDPSVHTILIGHSMGGIVAADTLLALATDKPIDADSSATAPTSVTDTTDLATTIFPFIQGVLAFDTPYLGISPGVVAHGAEGHYNSASEALSQLSTLSGMIWGGGAGATVAAEAEKKQSNAKKPVAALPAPPAVPATESAWGRWGKIAMYAGAAGAVAAGGAAAYMNRDQISQGWGWAYSHLEFVGCLMRGEELKQRVSGVLRVHRELGVGFGNVYTKLGKGSQIPQGSASVSVVKGVMGNERTFCNLPKQEAKNYFYEAVNDAAPDETWAHMSMFYPKDNPGYYGLLERAKGLVVEWTEQGKVGEWYQSSAEEKGRITEGGEVNA